MTIRPLMECIEHNQPGKDKTGLGWWSMMTFKRESGRTRVICGYNSCYNKNPKSRTTYQQHCRYFVTQRKDLTCPWTKFKEDLVSQLQQSRKIRATV